MGAFVHNIEQDNWKYFFGNRYLPGNKTTSIAVLNDGTFLQYIFANLKEKL